MESTVANARGEIQQLLHRYAHAFDAGEFAAFAALFEHGTLHLQGVSPPVSGIEEVLAMIECRVILYDGVPRTNHLIHNSLIDVAPDGTSATAASYVQVLQLMPDGAIETIATGVYRDDLVVDADGNWQFSYRNTLGSLAGNLRYHLRSLRAT